MHSSYVIGMRIHEMGSLFFQFLEEEADAQGGEGICPKSSCSKGPFAYPWAQVGGWGLELELLCATPVKLLRFQWGPQDETSKQANKIITNCGQLWGRRIVGAWEIEYVGNMGDDSIMYFRLGGQRGLRLRPKNWRKSQRWGNSMCKGPGTASSWALGNYKKVAGVALARRRGG